MPKMMCQMDTIPFLKYERQAGCHLPQGSVRARGGSKRGGGQVTNFQLVQSQANLKRPNQIDMQNRGKPFQEILKRDRGKCVLSRRQT